MEILGMAGASVTGHCQLVLAWQIQAMAWDGVSRVLWELALEADAQGRVYPKDNVPWAVDFGTRQFSGTADIGVEPESRKVLASGSVLLPHDADGTGEFPVTFSLDPGSPVEGSAVITAEALPVASVPTVRKDTVELGGSIAIYTNRTSQRCTHTLELLLGDTRRLLAEDVEGMFTWYPEESLAELFPCQGSFTAAILCTTWLDGRILGMPAAVYPRVTVPSRLAPTLEYTLEDLSGAMDKVGFPVAGISRPVVRITASAQAGAHLTGAWATLGGVPCDGRVAANNGSQRLEVWATDSRGLTTAGGESITVRAYRAPELEITLGDDGTVKLEGYWDALDGANSALLKLGWEGGTEEISPERGRFSLERVLQATAVTAVLEDKLLAVARVAAVGAPILEIGEKGVALGTCATREGFDCAMPAFFTGGIHGALPAVESATAGCWCREVDGETEWIDPPEIPGTVYRTARRFKGKPVYVLVLEGTAAALVHGAEFTKLVGLEGVQTAADGTVRPAQGLCCDGQTVSWQAESGSRVTVRMAFVK